MSDLSLGLEITGVTESIAAIERTKRAQDDLGRSAQASSRATVQGASAQVAALRSASGAAGNLAQSAQQMAGRLGGAMSAIQGVTSQLGGGSRAAGLAGAMFQSAAQSIALASSMGPLGLAIAGVTTATTLGNLALSSQREALEASRESARRLTSSLDDLISAQQTAITNAARLDRVQRGEGSLAEQRGYTQQAQNQYDLIRRALENDQGAIRELRRLGISTRSDVEASVGQQALSAITGSSAYSLDEQEREFLRERQRRLGEIVVERSGLQGGAEAVAADTGRTGGVTDTGRPGGRRRGGGGGGRGGARRESLDDLMSAAAGGDGGIAALAGGPDAYADAQARVASEDKDKAQRTAEATAEALRTQATATREAAEAQRELNEAAEIAVGTFESGYISSIDTIIARWEDAQGTLKMAGQSMMQQSRLLERGMVVVGNNIAETIGGTMKGAFEDALGAWLDGSKSFVEAAEDMVKGVLKALVIESIVQGVVELARGIADLAGYRYDSATLHFAAAGAWAAVGVAAGAVGAGIGAFGGGGAAGDKSASQGADNRDLARGSVSERESTQPIMIVVNPVWQSQRQVEAFVYGGVNGGAAAGRRIDSRAVRGMGSR